MLVAATFVILGLGVVHSGLGEWLILTRLGAAKGLPRLLGSEGFTRRTLRFVWHLPTLLAMGSAAVTFRSSRLGLLTAGERFALDSLATSLGACAVLTFGVTRGRHLGWVAFLGAAGLTFFGGR